MFRIRVYTRSAHQTPPTHPSGVEPTHCGIIHNHHVWEFDELPYIDEDWLYRILDNCEYIEAMKV